jgi:hypothetical protein
VGPISRRSVSTVSLDSGQFTVKPATIACARENRQSPTQAIGK